MSARLMRRIYDHHEFDVVWSGTQDRAGDCPHLTADGHEPPCTDRLSVRRDIDLFGKQCKSFDVKLIN
jgi:hypothetical protein